LQRQQFLKLVDKYLTGQATVAEEQLLLELFESFQEDEEWDEQLLGVKQQLEDEMLASIRQAVSQSKVTRQPKVKKLHIYRNIAAAVVVFAMVGTAVNHWLNKAPQSNIVASAKPASKVKHDVEPGKNLAILTLANGEKLILDSTKNGVIAKKGGISIKKTRDGQLVYTIGQSASATQNDDVAFNTISTPRGGQYQVVLPDGTKVWLNAASSLKFPTAFPGNERNVELTGEAYFEVAKNANKPFHVKVNAMQVAVLGTHFNVNAYSDEDAVKTTLLEGSVKLTQGNVSSMLRPGEQGVVNKAGNIKVVTADLEQAIAWKNGYFEFNRSNIADIMKQLSRWYDTKVTYEGSIPDDEFVGKIARSVKLSQVLHILELSHVHFKIEDKKIIVTP